MKTTIAITVSDLIRALRGRAHDLAESVEGGYRRDRDGGARPERQRDIRAEGGEGT